MDGLSNVASGLVSAGVADSVSMDVLKAVNNLSAVQSAMLFSSIGLGRTVDTYA